MNHADDVISKMAEVTLACGVQYREWEQQEQVHIQRDGTLAAEELISFMFDISHDVRPSSSRPICIGGHNRDDEYWLTPISTEHHVSRTVF